MKSKIALLVLMIGLFTTCINIVSLGQDEIPEEILARIEIGTSNEVAGTTLTNDDFLLFQVSGEEDAELTKNDNNVLTMMQSEGNGVQYYFVYDDPDVKENDEEDGIDYCTFRGIDFCNSGKRDVVDKYGTGVSGRFDQTTDFLYSLFRDNGYPSEAEFMIDNMYSYLLYYYKDIAQIAFYFNSDDKLCLVVYYSDIYMDPDSTCIKKVQSFLNDSGYDVGEADGIKGQKTSAAILSFKEDHGLFANDLIDDELMKCINSVTESPETETQDVHDDTVQDNTSEGSIVYDTYQMATNLTKDMLSHDGDGYSYNGIDFTKEDDEWIDSPSNTEGTVEAGAFYRKCAKYLAGYKMGLGGKSNLVPIIGFEPETKEEADSYADNASEFIIEEGQALPAIMKKLQTLNCVSGVFDFENWKYAFTISDLTECAKEMMISEEMLGYILAELSEYAPEVSFDGNSYSFSLN